MESKRCLFSWMSVIPRIFRARKLNYVTKLFSVDSVTQLCSVPADVLRTLHYCGFLTRHSGYEIFKKSKLFCFVQPDANTRRLGALENCVRLKPKVRGFVVQQQIVSQVLMKIVNAAT